MVQRLPPRREAGHPEDSGIKYAVSGPTVGAVRSSSELSSARHPALVMGRKARQTLHSYLETYLTTQTRPPSPSSLQSGGIGSVLS